MTVLNKDIAEPNNPDQMIDPSTVESLLDLISVNCRNILLAFYYQKKSMKEIALSFGLSSDQVARNRKSRCMKSLTDKIKELNLNLESFTK